MRPKYLPEGFYDQRKRVVRILLKCFLVYICRLQLHSLLLPAATKLGQGNIFTGVCLSTGGSASVHAGIYPPGSRPPPPGADPLQDQTPREQTRPPEQTPPNQTPLGADTPPSEQTTPPTRHPLGADTPPPGSRLQHTVNERPVRILLECILVKTEMEFCSHHEEKPHLCDICGKAFTTIDALGKHKETEHTSEHLFHLFVCSSLAEGSNENLKMQRSTHISMETMQIKPPSAAANTDKQYLPNLCHEPCRDSGNIEFYSREHKSPDMLNVKDTVANMNEIDVKPNLWDICHNAFTNLNNLLQHKEACTYCGDHIKGPSSTMQNPNPNKTLTR